MPTPIAEKHENEFVNAYVQPVGPRTIATTADAILPLEEIPAFLYGLCA